MDDWDDLRLFLALARGGSLAAAGEQLELDPSTVFRRLRRLEARLETELVERRSRGYRLTAAGEQLAQHAESIEERVLAAGRTLAGTDLRPRGRVRLTTTDTLAVPVMPPILAALRCEYPDLVVELSVNNRAYVLTRGEADVALRPGARPTEADVVPTRLVAIEAALFASRGYLARHGSPKSLGLPDLAAHRVVGLDHSLASIPYAEAIAAHVPADAIAMRSSSLLVQCEAVAAGVGVGLLPCFLASGRKDLVQLSKPLADVRTDLWLLVHRDVRDTARVRACADFIGQRIRASAARFGGMPPQRRTRRR